MVDGIVVCVGLGRDLERTLPWNRHHLDRLVVVTSSKDAKTSDIAKWHGAEVVICDDCDRGADSFNKGIMLNAGLDHLKPHGWTLFFDADIMLNPRTYRLDKLDPECLYYTTRHQIQSRAEWEAINADFGNIMRLPHGPLDSMPYGYFQLWHPEAECLQPRQRVSEQFPTAGGVDQWWAFRWPKAQWSQLGPEYHVGHLSHGGFGARWHGASKDPSKWQWVGWSRGDQTRIEQMPQSGEFRLIALDTGDESLCTEFDPLFMAVRELRATGSIEQIDVYWRAGNMLRGLK